jgi:hypothetical protein
MGKLPKDWQAYQRRNGRLKMPRRPNKRLPSFSWRKRWRRSHHIWAWVIVLLLAAGVWIDGYDWSIWDRGVTDQIQTLEGGSGRPVSPRDVIDGDTVRLRGQTFRLVGFDTPETGRQARCAYERERGNAATARLQSLIRTAANAELYPVQCSCRPGTHGTSKCNYGRSCGTLRVDGREVGDILISEGLARRFVCGPTSCPRRRPWC